VHSCTCVWHVLLLAEERGFLLPQLQADLFGDVADAKEASEFAAAYKEAKRCRAYETYQLLASVVTFGERVGELLTTVQVSGRQRGGSGGRALMMRGAPANTLCCQQHVLAAQGSMRCISFVCVLDHGLNSCLLWLCAEPSGGGQQSQGSHQAVAAPDACNSRSVDQSHRCGGRIAALVSVRRSVVWAEAIGQPLCCSKVLMPVVAHWQAGCLPAVCCI
jgi:hypothetical protein